jgi:tetratricopeptide (TPR) repeat protein
MGNHVQSVFGAWNVELAKGHASVLWPQTVPVRLRYAGGLQPAKIGKRNGMNVIDLSLDKVAQFVPPKHAPGRFGIGRAIELTTFGSWAEVATTLAPLYQKASVIPPAGPLRDEVAKIAAATADPVKRAEAALALTQDRVRYVALNLGEAGMVPASAAETWSRRFGDCKGKTVLLIGLLRELGIQSIPVAVHSSSGDGIDERLPMPGMFDHVLVRASVGGRDYWLDGTRTGETSLARLNVPDAGFGLEIVPVAGKLVRMVARPLDVPMIETSIDLDASGGLTLPAPAKIRTVMRGAPGAMTHTLLAQQGEAARKEMLRAYWKSRFAFIDVTSAESSFDKAEGGVLSLTMTGSAKMDWSGGDYETDETVLGFKPDWERPAGQDRDAPIAVGHPNFVRVTERIKLPTGFVPKDMKAVPLVKETLAGVEYQRQVKYEDDVFVAVVEERSLVPEVSYAAARKDEARLRELAGEAVRIRIPATYRPSGKELTALAAKPLTDADSLIERGNQLLNAGRFDEAIRDFSQIILEDPDNDLALANRGVTRAWKGDAVGAAADLDAAAKLNPKSPVVFRGRGMLHQRKGEHGEAAAAYTKSLEFDENNGFALGRRAEAYHALGDDDRALADATKALELSADWVDMNLLRANIHTRAGRTELAVAEADTLARKTDGYALVTASKIYARFDKRPQAEAAIAAALALKPEAYIYLNRAAIRRDADVAGRKADYLAALKLEPNNLDALSGQAFLAEQEKDWAGAAAIIERALKIERVPDLLIRRGILRHRLGRPAEGSADFKAAAAMQSGANGFNNMCWAKATAGVALESALDDCNEALKLVPGQAAYLDSRGLVMLRLGRFDEAIDDYTKAMAKSDFASALMGRALAYARKGDAKRAAADRAAAIKQYAEIEAQYLDYGLTLAATAASN